ncbi:MAG: DUF4390 domain-containing protein [Desulfobacterales bacterium]|nr:DUF4390 domain-containing protein [Desulfobacterales bacterium]
MQLESLRSGKIFVKKTRFFLLILLAVVLIPAMVPAGAAAQKARLTDMVVSNTRDDLLLFVTVKGAFTEQMKQAVLNGIPTSFSFIVRLEKSNVFVLPNTLVAEKKVTHTIKYESLKKQFVVRRSWEENRTLTTDSFEKARQWMSEIKSLRIAAIDRLQEGKKYRIRAKARLDTVELPFYLNYVFFFVSLWDFETNWHSIEFGY